MRWVARFLTSPEGAFYTSQDADLDEHTDGHAYFKLGDAARRKRGMPRVDQHVYPRENGWMIDALVALSQASGDPTLVARAQTAGKWIFANRRQPDGVFRHGEADRAGPYLGDTLAMASAFLSLYTATKDDLWLTRAVSAARAIDAHFADRKAGGYLTAPSPADAAGVFKQPVKIVDEQVALVRFAARLYAQTRDLRDRNLALNAMRYLASPTIIDDKLYQPGVLLADRELAAALAATENPQN